MDPNNKDKALDHIAAAVIVLTICAMAAKKLEASCEFAQLKELVKDLELAAKKLKSIK